MIGNGLPPEAQHDPETGEVREPMSSRASRQAQPRRHWDRVEGLVMRTPDEGVQSQYELAFLAAQMEILTVLSAAGEATITKDRSYSYTTLGQLMAHVRPIINKHGFTFKQGTGRIHKMGIDGGNQLYVPIYLKLTHVSTGESETYVTEMPLTKLDPQAVKSAKTYGKRQLIEDTFGIASADDDAIAAMSHRNLSRDDEASMVAAFAEKVKACKTVEELQALGKKNKESFSHLSEEAYNKAVDVHKTRLEELQEEMAIKADNASQLPSEGKGRKG